MGMEQKKELQLFLEENPIFIKELYVKVYNFCKKRLYGVCSEDLQDITQETIIAIDKAVKKTTFELKVLWTTFVYSIAKRKCMDYLRKKIGRNSILPLSELEGDNGQQKLVIQSLDNPHEILEREECIIALKTLLKMLPVKEYEIIIRNFLNGERIEDIAKDQNELPNTIAVKKKRILKKLAAKYMNRD